MKSIRGNLRGSNGVSFFAFQDVIMSVTGVVIVIALLLALQIDKVRIPGSPDDPSSLSTDAETTLASSGKLQELEIELAELKNKLAQLLVAARKGETTEEIQAEVAGLEERIERQIQLRNSKNINNSPAVEVNSERHKEAVRIEALKVAIGRCLLKLNEITPGNKELSKRLRALEMKVKQVESTVLKVREKERDLVLIPELNDTTKEPIIVDVSRTGLEILRIDKGAILRLTSSKNFSAYFKRLKTTDHYFVFFLRPSGISRFEGLRKVARQAGFEVGYDAIEEKTRLKLGRNNSR